MRPASWTWAPSLQLSAAQRKRPMPHLPRVAGPLAVCILAGTALGLAAPARSLPPVHWAPLAPPAPTRVMANGSDAAARLAHAAFGRSGQLRVAVADPFRRVDLPIEWSGQQPPGVRSRGMPLHGTRVTALLGESWLGAGLNAPPANGVWRLHL